MAAFLFGCEREKGEPSQRQQRMPLPTIIGDLREAREELEQYGCMAKTQIRHGLLGRNIDGQKFYIDAAKLHNGCIAFIGSWLDAVPSMDELSLKDRLSGADESRVRLLQWCNEHNPRGREQRPRSSGAPGKAYETSAPSAAGVEIVTDLLVRVLHEFLDYDLKLKELNQRARAAQIGRIKEELKACECRQWDRL